jgi:hypothetical protein
MAEYYCPLHGRFTSIVSPECSLCNAVTIMERVEALTVATQHLNERLIEFDRQINAMNEAMKLLVSQMRKRYSENDPR